jgi:hypothetical protein
MQRQMQKARLGRHSLDMDVSFDSVWGTVILTRLTFDWSPVSNCVKSKQPCYHLPQLTYTHS